MSTIGILGAGKLGVVVAQLALRAGYKVYIAGSGAPDKIALTTEVITPGAIAVTSRVAVKMADIVILAMPLSKFHNIPVEELSNKVVIDAMNHWWEVDGPRSDTIPDVRTTSSVVQEFIPRSKVVKGLSHMGYHNLLDESRAAGDSDRKAIAIAGDDMEAVSVVRDFVDDLGFDVLFVGSLDKTHKLEAGGPVFGANLDKVRLKEVLGF